MIKRLLNLFEFGVFLVILVMEWGGTVLSLCFVVTSVESSRIPEALWAVSLSGEHSSIYNWTVGSAGVFVAVALVLSMYLIFEHLAAYNQPEV